MMPRAGEANLLAQLAALAPDAVDGFLEAHPELHAASVVDALADEVARLLHVDIDLAARAAEAARWLAGRLDERCQGRATRATAQVLYARNDFAAAVAEFDRAREAFERIGDEGELGRTLSSSIQPLIYLGRYDEAEASALRARRIFEEAGDRLRLARLDTNLANLYYRRDRFAQALVLYERAEAVLREVGEPRDAAVALRNLAVCHISLNHFAEALALHERARALSQSYGLHRLVVEADYNIAYLHYLRGEYTVALELYQRARARADDLGDDYHRALCDLDQSELYLELNLLEEGIALAEQAVAGFEGLHMGYERAKALTNLAVGVGRQGEAFRALGILGQAREVFVAEGNDFWTALIDTYRGLVLHQEGRHFEARRLCQDALRFFAAVGQASKAALAELVLARIHLSVGELVSARLRCLRALDLLRRANSPDLSHRAHFLLGQVEEALGAPAAARAAYEASHERLENLRSHLEQDELKIGFLKDKLAVYESLVAMSLAAGGSAETARAFDYIEQAKSRSLADLLAFRAAVLPASPGVRSGLVEQVRRLRHELNGYYRHLDEAEIGRTQRSPAHLEALRQESRARETELLRLLRDMGTEDPDFASLQSGHSVGLDRIRSTLPLDCTILEFYQARGTLLAAIVTHGAVEIVPLTPASRARRLLQLLQFQLSKFRLGEGYVRTFERTLREATAAHLRGLYAELIRPVRDRLGDGRLVVVPHDFLHYLPFHALLDGDTPLAERFVMTYAPSASVYHLCCTKRPRGTDSLVMGVPDAATPHIRDEVEAVARHLPRPRVFLGEEATEENLRRHGPTGRFIHIATHGRFRHDNPMFSSVQLGTSRLSLFDLYQLELPAELVTLSGCGTGLNVAEGGDELLGLVRGLLYAGTQAALVTLWDVNDRSTAEFMSAFYSHLRGGADKGLALQRAMREIRERYPHPYHWAPFVLVGRGA